MGYNPLYKFTSQYFDVRLIVISNKMLAKNKERGERMRGTKIKHIKSSNLLMANNQYLGLQFISYK